MGGFGASNYARNTLLILLFSYGCLLVTGDLGFWDVQVVAVAVEVEGVVVGLWQWQGQ